MGKAWARARGLVPSVGRGLFHGGVTGAYAPGAFGAVFPGGLGAHLGEQPTGDEPCWRCVGLVRGRALIWPLPWTLGDLGSPVHMAGVQCIQGNAIWY